MFTLEKQSRDWERRHPQYTRSATPEDSMRYEEMRKTAEMVSLIEEAALVEREQFGFAAHEADERMVEAEELEAFWTFAVDLFDEPRAYVLTELY